MDRKTDELWQDGYKVYQNDECFPLCTDSVLLAAFASLSPRMKVCDLGCGAGVLPLLLLGRRQDMSIEGIDIQESAVRFSKENAALNGVEDKTNFTLGDICEAESIYGVGVFDMVISNPPYFTPESGKVSAQTQLRTARSEQSCTLEQLCRSAGRILKYGGSFCMVYRCERLADLICELKKNRLEPKRLRFVIDKPGTAPEIFLIDARLGRKSGLAVLPDLVMRNGDGTYTDELLKIYRRI